MGYSSSSYEFLRARDLGFEKARRVVEIIIENLDLPRHLEWEILKYIRIYASRHKYRKDILLYLVSIGLYNVLRSRGRVSSPKEIARLIEDITGEHLETRRLHKMMMRLQKQTDSGVEPSPKIYELIDYGVDKLRERGIEVGDTSTVKRLADTILEEMRGVFPSTPKVVSSLALYIAAKMEENDFNVDMELIEEISEIMGISQHTLARWVRKLNNVNSTLIARTNNG